MKRTILIADDEKNIREGLAMDLELEGFDCVLASDGLEAWNIINKQPIDLVVSDLRMPGITGEELLKRISGSYPMLPVVILTGHGNVCGCCKQAAGHRRQPVGPYAACAS